MLNRNNRFYGELPKNLGSFSVDMPEMTFIQYMPIKLASNYYCSSMIENRFKPYEHLITACIRDFISKFGRDEFYDRYVYLTVKNLYQSDKPYNREGWHSDGFMSDDINYIWSDSAPTIFSDQPYILTKDHKKSMAEMIEQSNPDCDITYSNESLIRLDEYNIHRVSDDFESGMRNFFKLSISKDKYNLKGNAINHRMNYSWNYIERDIVRNHPSK